MFAVLPVFTACDDDDDYYYVHNGDVWTTYGNLEKIDNGSRQEYAIRLDDGDRLIVTDGLGFSADEGDEGMRVHLRYAYVGSEREESGLDTPMDYYIRLYNISEVLCKQPVTRSFVLADEEHRLDSIGNDPINVTDDPGRIQNHVYYSPLIDSGGDGTYYYQDEWYFYDNILLRKESFDSEGWEYSSAGIVRPRDAEDAIGRPDAYDASTGNGFSDHFPVQVSFMRRSGNIQI